MLEFISSSSQRLVSASTFAPTSSTGSVTFWVKPLVSLSGVKVIMQSATSYTIFTNGGVLSCGLWRASGKRETGSTLSVGTRYFLAFTYYPGSKQVNNIYINGALDATGDNNSSTPGTLSLYIADNGVGAYADVEIEDFRIYNGRALSLAEIQTIYGCNGHDGIVDGLTHRWRMNESSGIASGAGSVKDDVGSINMTPSGSPVYKGSELTFLRRLP